MKQINLLFAVPREGKFVDLTIKRDQFFPSLINTLEVCTYFHDFDSNH